MDETDSICFVCDKTISSENWKYKLLETASKKRNVPVADLIKQLVGNEFAVLVGHRDVVCRSCMNLLNLMDALTAQLKTVQTTLSNLIYSKYNLESESSEFQVEYDNSVAEKTEPLYKCDICNFETKYEKEYNMHIRTHNSGKSTNQINIIKSKLSDSKPLRKKRKFKSNKKPIVNIQKATTKGKRKTIVKPKEKKTKIVFQCSVCNEIFPSEISIKSHAKKAHGNENIIVSEDESEYEDIQTLESDGENTDLQNMNKSPKQTEASGEKKALDFLDDWNDEENGDLKLTNNSNTQEQLFGKVSLSREDSCTLQNKEYEEFDDDGDEEQDTVRPTCMFCNAKFASAQSVQDHIKMTHRDRTSNLNLGLKTSNKSMGCFEIDSTTDIVENNNSKLISGKPSTSKIKAYKCNICGIKKVSFKFIKKHIQAHKRKIALQCKLCGMSFRNMIAVKVHRYRCYKVVGVKRKCTQCKMIFIDNKQLNMHIKKVHNKPIKQEKKTKLVMIESTSRYSLRKTVDSSNKVSSNLKKSTLKRKLVNSNIVLAKDISKISSCEVSSTSLESDSSTHQKYICSLCNFISNSDLEMKGHMKKHEMEEDDKTGQILTVKTKSTKGKDQLKCHECETYFSKPSQLVNHISRHKANTCLDMGICFYCNRLFLEKEQVIIHINAKHNFKFSAKCTVCGKQYSHGKDLKLHYLKSHFSTKTENLIKQISDKTNYTKANDVYSKVFKELQDLTGEGHDGEDISEDISVSDLCYSCPLCDFGDYNKGIVENHLTLHPHNYCNICKNIFNTEECIKHIENHSIDFQNKKCSDCDETFHDLIHLQSHSVRVHSGKKLYKCSMCEKTYVTEKSMLFHKQRMHRKSSKKELSCIKCNKIFYSEKYYQTHVEFAHRTTLNCKYCDKTLNDVKKLVHHERNHLKQANSVYKCSTCGKVLKTPLQLKRHKTIHNSNASLHCEVCSKSFKSIHALREHSANHLDTQEKKFFCDVCGKGFYFYDSHYRHRRIHLDPLLFKCKTCGERFQTKTKLLEHKNNCNAVSQCTKCLKSFNADLEFQNHVCLFYNSNTFSQ